MENVNTRNPIKTFRDLIVYKNLYQAMLTVHKNIAPNLPKNEQFDLVPQIKRASKACPALIAEGFAKRYQKRYWHKYITDTLGECNEMIHHLTVCIDLYSNFIDTKTCNEAIELYTICCKQLTRLAQSWTNYHAEK